LNGLGKVAERPIEHVAGERSLNGERRGAGAVSDEQKCSGGGGGLLCLAPRITTCATWIAAVA